MEHGFKPPCTHAQEGVGYRLSRIDGIFDTHLRVAGVQRLSYSANGESAIAGGDSTADLEVARAFFNCLLLGSICLTCFALVDLHVDLN